MNDPVRRRLVREPDAVLDKIQHATGHEMAVVGRVVTGLRAVVDDLLADSHVVALGALTLAFGDSMTRRALLERLASPEPVPDDVWDKVWQCDHAAVAAYLGLSFESYSNRPLATPPLVVAETLALLGDAAPAPDVVWDVFDAWERTFDDGRPYKVSTVGLEAAAERWLVDNLDRLADHGWPVTLHARQLVLPSGKKPDLVCRFTQDAGSVKIGDWLVVELKAGRFHDAAADQLAGYLNEVELCLADEREHVCGILVTDGADQDDVDRLTSLGIGHLSLAALGYRLALTQNRPSGGTAMSASAPTITP